VHDWGQFIGKYSIDHIIASDLGRVKETVAIIRQYCNPVSVEWKQELREQAWGEWEGKSFGELKTEQPENLLLRYAEAGISAHQVERAEKKFYNEPFPL